jgi:hypothetical protein
MPRTALLERYAPHARIHPRHRLAGDRLCQIDHPARHQSRPAIGGTRRHRAMGDRPERAVPRALLATAEKPQMERDATADVLVAELRQVIADLRRGQDDLRQERDKWQAAHEREQAAHAATQRLLLPPPATPTAQDATPVGEGETAAGTPRNRLLRTWRWLRTTG